MDTSVKQKLDDFFKQYQTNPATYKNQKYKKGEILIRAGELPGAVFYLKDGVVKMYAISPSGEELILNIYKPVSFFPMSWVLNNTLSNHYYEALTAVTVWKASKEHVLKFLKKEPDVLLDLVRRIYSGLEGFFMRMEYLMAGSAQAKLLTELIIYARRFGEKNGKKITVKLKLTERELASQAGIARETVSRQIHKLINKELISYKKNTLIVNDLEKLTKELTVKFPSPIYHQQT